MDKYCFVVRSEEGNPYDIGVFMSFESMIKYFKVDRKWKIGDSITPEEFAAMCARVWIMVSEMKVFD
jgi:hypothetical protein